MSDEQKKPADEQSSLNGAEPTGAQDAEAPEPDASAVSANSASSEETSSDSVTAETSVTTTPQLEDELPDIEPLTPELVEEEAIRGDFMLRWAAIFLALLFGFSKMSDTRTLVHIKTGEQMQSDGFLPSAVDTLSFSAEGKPAVNLSWLFDHLTSLVWSAAGDAGLSVFKALLAAITAWILSRISVPEMPTWWNSICAVFAIVACSGDFTVSTEIITLLGMVILMAILHQHREGVVKGITWKLPLLIAVWANLDPRAWIGSLATVLYAIGLMTVRSRRESAVDAGKPPETMPAGQGLGLAAALAVAALLLNPFPLNSLLSATSIYSVEYPTMQEQRPLMSSLAGVSFDNRVDYFSMLDPDAFTLFDHTQIAGIALILIAVIALILSQSAADRGFAFMLAGLSVLAIYATHELPVTALTAAVISGTVIQRWYRRNFNLQYSVDTKELMFSRGGRAVTVFVFAFLGFCVVAGRLPGNTPVGLGFEEDTKTTIRTIGEQLAEIPEDARILHTRIDQGDILIWHGRKSAIDSRIIPFGRMSNPDSITARHRMILRNYLRPPQPAIEDEEKKKQEEELAAATQYVEELNVTHMMPRLAPPGVPDYQSIQMLATRPDWLLVELGPSAAFLERVSPDLPQAERAKKLPAFGVQAFQEAESTPAVRVDFARTPDFYETWIYRKRPSQDEHVRQAEHYLRLSGGQMQSLDQVIASLSLTTLAIRELNQSLYTDPQNSYGYRLLGECYRQINNIEGILSGVQPEGSSSTREELRYMQSVMALRQSLNRNPDDVDVWGILYQLYSSRNKQDLALAALEKWLSLQGSGRKTIQQETLIKEMRDTRNALSDVVKDNQQRLEEMMQSNPLPEDATEKGNAIIGLASSLIQAGFPLQALGIMKDHDVIVQQNPMGQTLMGALLLESGDVENGYRSVTSFARIARDQPDAFPGMQWHLGGAISQLSIADYQSAIEMLSIQLKEIEQAKASPEPYRGVLLSAPLASEVNLLPQAMISQWPIGHLSSLQLPVAGVARAESEVRFLIALCHIEDGNVQAARLILQAIIVEDGESASRNLASYYLSLMDKDGLKFIEEHSYSPWEDFDFVAFADNSANTDGGSVTAAPDTAGKPAVRSPEPALEETPAETPQTQGEPKNESQDSAPAEQPAAKTDN
ncbi:MAG: hypothetical protein R3C20_03795 [Planctomycetaceae bacterium]